MKKRRVKKTTEELAFFSCYKASEGGRSFRDTKMMLEDAGIRPVRPASSPYVGQYGLSVPKKFEEKTARILYR